MTDSQDMTSQSISGKEVHQAGDPDAPLFAATERFVLDPNSPVPLYYQMEQIILDRIAQKGTVGRKLPREMDLVEIFGVSRATVKKTTDNLAARGLIERKRAVGTRIIQQPITEDLARLRSYTEQMKRRGLRVSTEVLEVKAHLPSAAVQEKLQLDEGQKTLCIRRLRGTSEVFPVVLLQSDIPVVFGIDPTEDFCGSLYQMLEEDYQIPIEWADEEISAGRASAEEAELLRIEPKDVVLIMQRLTFTRKGRPLEVVRAVYRPEYYTFSVRLKR